MPEYTEPEINLIRTRNSLYSDIKSHRDQIDYHQREINTIVKREIEPLKTRINNQQAEIDKKLSLLSQYQDSFKKMTGKEMPQAPSY